MITYDRYLAILAESDASVRGAAESAFATLLEKIRAGASPRVALNAVLKEFNADAIEGFREALNAILQSSLGVAEVKAYRVGRLKLSDALYANAQAVAGVSQQLIEKHMAGVHTAQELRKALYEGYNFQDDPLKVVKPLPKYLQVEFDKFKAANLKTPALRAAYLEAIKKAEAGAGMDALEKVLKGAFYERNRYFANRIARTELHRNYTDQVARELMEEEEIEYVQIRMSSKHPKTDICDRHAKLDAYGLGPGVYPKADAPKPPFHPHCYCVVSPRIDLDPKTPPRFNPKAEQAFLAKLDPKEARDIAGSWDKLKRAKGGETLEDIYNEGKDPLYRWKKLGEFIDKPIIGVYNNPNINRSANMNVITPITPMALCPPRAKTTAAVAANKKAVIEWKPTASGLMRADFSPYGKGWKMSWDVGVSLTKNGRPATGTDASASVKITIAFDEKGRWQARLAPGQDEGERLLILEGEEGGYPAAQAAVAAAMADYVAKTIGKRRSYIPVALRSPLGGGHLVTL